MKDYMSPDTPNRDRTFADRKAFVLAEQTLETAKALAEANAPKGPEPLATDAIVDPNWAKGRERQSIREAATASRRDAFLHALGELTYRALPLDEHEKAPHRATVLEQTKELAHSLIEHWDLSPAGRELEVGPDEPAILVFAALAPDIRKPGELETKRHAEPCDRTVRLSTGRRRSCTGTAVAINPRAASRETDETLAPAWPW